MHTKGKTTCYSNLNQVTPSLADSGKRSSKLYAWEFGKDLSEKTEFSECTHLASIILELFGETRELLNDRGAQIFCNHLMLTGLIAQLVEQIFVRLETSKPAKTKTEWFGNVFL